MESIKQSQYEPSTRSRRRQFSRVRQDHSQNSRAASRSHDRSMKASFIKRLDFNEPKLQLQTTARKTDKQSRRNNIRSNTQIQSHSATKLLCVGCFNHELFQARERKKTREHKKQQDIQRFTQSVMECSAQNNILRNKFAQQYQKMNEYNQRRIQYDRQKKKQDQINQRQKNERLRYEQQIQNRRRLQMQTKLNHQKRERIKQELEEQIKRRKIRVLQQEKLSKMPIEPMFDEPARNKNKMVNQQHYRKQLLKQIYQQRDRKKQSQWRQRNQKQQEAQYLTWQNSEKQKIRKVENQRKRTILLEQARRRKEEVQRKKQEQKHIRYQQQKQRLAELEFENRLRRQKQKIKQHETIQHLRGLKKQIHEAEIKKKQEEAYRHLPVGTILSKKSTIIQRQCDSCQKYYPKQQLTLVVQPFQV